MDGCEVTILVAVYNTEPYLHQCLDSLLAQTMDSLQIICIDDASTDGSAAILQDYAAKDRRVEVITLTTNCGQAYARNQGLAMARGRYIGYLDSDDWMAPDCVEKAVATFVAHPDTGCVLLHTLYWHSPTRQEEYPMAPFERMSGEEAFRLSLTWKIHGVYIVKAEIHRQYPYDESARAFSDDNTTRLHYLNSKEVRLCEGTYYYRQRGDSISHSINLRRFDYLTANISMKQTLHHIGVTHDISVIYENHRWLNIIDLYMLFFRHRASMRKTERTQALHQLRVAWESIDTSLLFKKNRLKFGYAPMRGSWMLFRLQEECYFMLRRCLGR